MDNYKTIKFLNKGSFGKIYLVEYIKTRKLYALKSIKIQDIDRYSKISILNELKILLINNNDYLLKCYDLFIHNNKLCIITEYIDGGDLDKYIKDNKLSNQQEIVDIFLKLCVGINSLHLNNIIHRDIKPSNILITKEGHIKICDFGISKFLDYSKITSTRIGTPYFMSPEQMSSQYYDYKIDVWGIGCVLFYLLYNKYPFNGRDMNELKKNIQRKNPFSKNNNSHDFISNNIQERLEIILKEMFEKNKLKRLDLNTFLDNSRDLLDYYDIVYDKRKYVKYNIKTVPYTINDWNIILNKLKLDFNLPNFDKEKILENSLKKPLDLQPEINTYAQIKRKKYNISPLPDIINSKPKKLKQNSILSPVIANVKASDQVHYEIKPKIYNKLKSKTPTPYYNLPQNSYVDTLQRLKIQESINNRRYRIKKQQFFIDDQRKKALYRIQEHKKNISDIKNNHNSPCYENMQNRIRKAQSKIKHLWARPHSK
tara:strand:+ start:1403 stop:2854 length:1452 start_codon:yes stop_codon:yes gene_type:complete